MPSPIQGAAASAAIVSLIKQAMGAQSSARARGVGGRAKGRAAGTSNAGPHADAQHELGNFIASRVRELNPDAPDHKHRLMRVVVEATLLHEFGSSLMTAPKFQAMVDQVLHDMAHSPLMRADMQAVYDELAGPR